MCQWDPRQHSRGGEALPERGRPLRRRVRPVNGRPHSHSPSPWPRPTDTPREPSPVDSELVFSGRYCTAVLRSAGAQLSCVWPAGAPPGRSSQRHLRALPGPPSAFLCVRQPSPQNPPRAGFIPHSPPPAFAAGAWAHPALRGPGCPRAPSAGASAHSAFPGPPGGASPSHFLSLVRLVSLSCHHPSVDPAVRPVLEPALCVDCPKNTFPCKTHTRLRHRVPVGVILCCTDVLRNI